MKLFNFRILVESANLEVEIIKHKSLGTTIFSGPFSEIPLDVQEMDVTDFWHEHGPNWPHVVFEVTA